MKLFLTALVVILFSLSGRPAFSDAEEKVKTKPTTGYAYFQSFGRIKPGLDFNGDPNQIKANPAGYFDFVLAHCAPAVAPATCKPKGGSYARSYCSAIGFSDAISWRTQFIPAIGALRLYWVLCAI